MVDKYRLEALELEKTFGMPVKEMTPGDQQQMKQLLTEFGQHRDSAKKERDSVILSFERTLHPYLYRYLEGMLKELLPAHLAKAKPVIETHNGDDVVEPSNQMDMETTQAPLADESSTETQSKPVAPSASEIQTEPLPQNIVMTGLSSESPVKTIQDKIPASNSAAELADTNMIHHALNMAENPVSMEVDTDKPNETSSVLPVKFVKDVQESVSLLDGHVQSKQPNGASVQAVDDLPENKQDRRKLVGERLKVLENGFKEAATTTEELGRKLEKLEEQVANQEEQLYEYLNTQALSNEGRADAAIASLNSSGNPLAEAKDEALIGRTTPPAHNIDEAILETARAEAVRTLEARLSDWSRAQDLRITEIAKAHETRLATVRDEIRAEIRTEAARAEEAYASAIQTAEEKATKLESQLSALQAELLAFKEERKVIERLKEHQNTSDQLVKTIRESTLKAQLTESQFRNGVNAKLGEIETRVTTHDSQMKDMSTFENTKEAWRKDMIDMKNHVIGRVDYLEEQVQSLKQPLMAARSNDQLPQPAASPLAEQLAVAQTTRENSGVRSPALQPPQMTTQQVPQRQSQTNQMLSQYTPTSIPIPQQSSGQTLPHIVNSDEGNQFTMQSARANSGEPSQVRLAINRGSGPLVNSVVPVSQSAAAPVSHSIQPSVFGQTWRPPFPGQSVSGQQSPGQPRLPSLQVDNEQAIYQPRAVPAGARSSANGSRINTNPASEGSLASRLNGGDIRSPVPRSDSTPASTLPLHMRMHNGNGVQVQTWMQPNNPVNTVGGNDPNGLTGPQSSVNDVAATGRLRIYAPGDIKPQQL
ncbi:hypothetical protein QFC19_004116 [Naganishia cerealis]|uniref:Uncharacterized protein n=1 Tax=Naganishia cerealis TaxID=610337 RepID=A0ACC2W0F6_9TREE|nr:hypothetical protein QFC19_004116 [Naganishia cerealis]